MVVDMSRHKADQTGEKTTPKHIYANPYQPAICPILAMGLHFFSISYRETGDDHSKIFVGTISYDNFSRWLRETLGGVEILGFKPDDYGTHSYRKGAATHCAGFIGGPSIITIYLRAEWTFGTVQDRYLLYVDAGDQLCGRIICGLTFNDGVKFSVLPPRFENPGTILTPAEWQEILPGYLDFPSTFQPCFVCAFTMTG